MPSQDNANSFALDLPAQILQSKKLDKKLNINIAFGIVTLPNTMFNNQKVDVKQIVLSAKVIKDEIGMATVVWDDIPSSAYAELGQFTVNGVIEGSNISCYATVTVGYRPLDLNKDGEINLIDLAEVSYYYGKAKIHMTQAQWQQIKYVDINNDNEINMQDLRLLSYKIG